METLTFEALPKMVAEMNRKIDLLADQLNRNDPEPDRLMSKNQFQDYLEKKTGKLYASQTVYQWVTERSVPYVKFGKYLYFRKSEIDTWLANGRRI